MLTRLIWSVTIIVRRHAHRVGQNIKHVLRPARTAAMLAGAAGLDALRPRSDLLAENALLRQQILVLRRAAPPRPRLYREDRLLLVLLARLTRAWRDGLHLIQPATVSGAWRAPPRLPVGSITVAEVADSPSSQHGGYRASWTLSV
jgi:hypothetical protein